MLIHVITQQCNVSAEVNKSHVLNHKQVNFISRALPCEKWLERSMADMRFFEIFFWPFDRCLLTEKLISKFSGLSQFPFGGLLLIIMSLERFRTNTWFQIMQTASYMRQVWFEVSDVVDDVTYQTGRDQTITGRLFPVHIYCMSFSYF